MRALRMSTSRYRCWIRSRARVDRFTPCRPGVLYKASYTTLNADSLTKTTATPTRTTTTTMDSKD